MIKISRKTRVGNSRHNPSGRRCGRGQVCSMSTPRFWSYTYHTVLGRSGWPNRDPLGEQGGLNQYGLLENDSVNFIDSLGMAKLRFKVDIGVFNIFSMSGMWSQPYWAGNGMYTISSSSASSSVSLNNEANIVDFVHTTPDYCNTVQDPSGPNGQKIDAGMITVFAEDDCGGRFNISGSFNVVASGNGPSGKPNSSGQTSGYGFYTFTVNGRTLSQNTISPSSPSATDVVPISTDLTLKSHEEKQVAVYRPTLALKNRSEAGGISASVTMSGSISLSINPK